MARVPFVMTPNSSEILKQQKKVPRTFLQHHQVPFDSSRKIKYIGTKRKPTLVFDPNRCDVEYTPSIFRRSMKQLSQDELFSNGIGQKKEMASLTRGIFSFQQQQQLQQSDKIFNKSNNEQDGFMQDLFNTDHLMKAKLHQQGVLMRPDIMQELELLLKNSLYSSTMLMNLINDLLDLAKIENSSFNLQATYFNLFEIINHGLDVLDFQAQQKDIRLIHQYEEEQVGYFMKIYGDQNRYLQILLNFLSNAIKFTPKQGCIVVETLVNETQDIQSPVKIDPVNQGQAKVKAFQVAESQKSHRSRSLPDELQFINKGTEGNEIINQKYLDFEIRIQDSGYGIQPENLDRLFMNFSKLEEHKTMNERGTGLGLSICKSLVELMGGSVQVTSKVGQGTTFVVKLKTKCQYVHQQEAAALARQIELNTKSRYSKHNRDTNQFQHPTTYNMMCMSNLSVVPQDMKLSRSQHGDAILEEESKSEAMMTYFKSHQDKLDRFVIKNSFGSISPQPKKSDQLTSKHPIAKCLVANDNSFQLMIVSRLLNDLHFAVDEAENGLVATQKAALEDYVFIILDLDMPIMNGYEACKRIKKKHNSEIVNIFQINTQRSDQILMPDQDKKPLVFALSAFINDQVIQELVQVGFDDFIETPFDIQKFQQKILPKISQRLQDQDVCSNKPFMMLQSTNCNKNHF